MQFPTAPLKILAQFGVGKVTTTMNKDHDTIIVYPYEHDMPVGSIIMREDSDKNRDCIYLTFPTKEQALDVYSMIVKRSVEDIIARFKEANEAKEWVEKGNEEA